MPRLDRIYTKTGDEGMTGLGGGRRVSEGLAAGARVRHGRRAELGDRRGPGAGPDANASRPSSALIQNELFDLGSDLCWPEDDERRARIPTVQPRHVERLERLIDELNERRRAADELPAARRLARCGPAPRGADHLPARRARGDHAGRDEPIGELVLPYLNRLSDALFVMARYENHERGVDRAAVAAGTVPGLAAGPHGGRRRTASAHVQALVTANGCLVHGRAPDAV